MPPRHQRTLHTKPAASNSKRPLRVYAQLVFETLATLLLAALSAEVSKVSLTPIYGSIPPVASLGWLRGGFEHDHRYVAHIVLLSLAKMFLNKHTLGMSKFYAMWGFFMPSIQSGLYNFSGKLGPEWGPRITYVLTSVPLSYLSLLHIMVIITDTFPLAIFAEGAATRSMKDFCNTSLGTLLLTSILYHFLAQLKLYLENWLPTLMIWNSGTHAVFSRFGIQAVLAILYTQFGAPFERFKLIFIAILPLLHLIIICPHVPLPYNTNVLNGTLRAEGYSLVARQESMTGYISVLDNVNEGYRVMRCDHSLLGGEYLRKPRGSRYNEPVYTIFLTLEAVRLLQTKASDTQTLAPNMHKRALVM